MYVFLWLWGVEQNKIINSFNVDITSEKSFGVPQVNTRKTIMQIEESVHYPLHGPVAEAEWATTRFLPGTGFIRSQKDHKIYLFPMSHQLHCLDYMRTAVSNSSAVDWKHLHHCFNFLRQWTLCEADTTLEIGDFAERIIYTEARMGAQHICRDWTPIVSALRDNQIEWRRWEKAQKNTNV